jgi:hypothetical protein
MSLAILSVVAPAMAAEEEWEVDGGGWGHGVGLSQYGAYGQALDGRNATQILQHYYTGTSLNNMPAGHWTTANNGLWVGLVSNTTVVNLAAVEGPLTICQPAADCSQVNQVINPGEAWKFEVNDEGPTQCRFRHVEVGNTGWGACNARVTGLSPTSRAKVNSTEYARGVIRFTPSTDGFHAVVTIGLEQYLYGLAEVPSSWPDEALKAQAIIGRSYAVATAVERGGADGTGKLASCGCHLRDSTADQAYAGWSKEDPANLGDRWTAAVDATAGQILTHPESDYALDIAKAFYSSSNGGASEDVEFVWGGAALPWLRSVSDPWSADPDINPLARWTVVVPSSEIEQSFGWDAVTMVEVTTGPPGAVVRFTGRNNGTTLMEELWGDTLRIWLGAHAYRRDGDPVRVSPYVIGTRYVGPFLDIAGSVFEQAIIWLAQEDITKGCNPPINTNYCPDGLVTRGQMAVFIARVLGLPAAQADHFSDDDGTFYEGAANRIFEAGITSGCGGTRYCGESHLTRGQMAKLLANALGLPAAAADHFDDDGASQFQNAINKIAEAGVTLGCNPPANTMYCPDDLVTRGQMAAFFRRGWGP